MQLIYELCVACAVLMLYRASHRRELALYNELKKTRTLKIKLYQFSGAIKKHSAVHSSVRLHSDIAWVY